MSKAFTREDDGGLEPERARDAPAPAPHTRMGHARLAELLTEALATHNVERAAEVEARLASGLVAPPDDPSVASLGAEVTLRDALGAERVVRLVTAAEVGLVPRGATPASPIGAAVAGARVGDEVAVGRGGATVIRIAWP